MTKNLILTLHLHKRNYICDIEVAGDVTANELVIALNQAYGLGIDLSDITKCYLKTENPIALLKGNKTLEEFGLRNRTIINYLR